MINPRASMVSNATHGWSGEGFPHRMVWLTSVSPPRHAPACLRRHVAQRLAVDGERLVVPAVLLVPALSARSIFVLEAVGCAPAGGFVRACAPSPPIVRRISETGEIADVRSPTGDEKHTLRCRRLAIAARRRNPRVCPTTRQFAARYLAWAGQSRRARAQPQSELPGRRRRAPGTERRATSRRSPILDRAPR